MTAAVVASTVAANIVNNVNNNNNNNNNNDNNDNQVLCLFCTVRVMCNKYVRLMAWERVILISFVIYNSRVNF